MTIIVCSVYSSLFNSENLPPSHFPFILFLYHYNYHPISNKKYTAPSHKSADSKGTMFMKKPGYYSSGQFARMAHVTLRTIRYYDKQDILKPSFVTEPGARFYTDKDFARLQQILLLKYLGFSLDDIREMTIDDLDHHFMLNSLQVQLKLIQDRIEQMQLVEKAIRDTALTIQENHCMDWSKMLNLIHLTSVESSLKNQYQDASNIAARIHLHSLYSQNSLGWFPWLYRQCRIESDMRILEIGCGDGTLWKENLTLLPMRIEVILSDISEGMLRDARRAVGSWDSRFSYKAFDCHQLPYEDESLDLVIANHVLFYCQDITRVCQEVKRVLKPKGRFICSAYSRHHMEEVSLLVQDFDERIFLSADKLYDKFGKENGSHILKLQFSNVEWKLYEDSLMIQEPEPLISYILSCHGNQNQYISERCKEFRAYVKKKTAAGFHITKEAGVFACEKFIKNL